MKWTLVAILVCATTIGDVCRSLGMKQHGEVQDFRPGAVRRAFSMVARNRMVILSTCAMAVSFFSFMKLVAIAPMSFAVPMSAATFIPETLLAKFLLNESVDWRRWIGVCLIVVGVVFISQ